MANRHEGRWHLSWEVLVLLRLFHGCCAAHTCPQHPGGSHVLKTVTLTKTYKHRHRDYLMRSMQQCPGVPWHLITLPNCEI